MPVQTRIADRQATAAPHPLDPLGRDEYARAVAILRAHDRLRDGVRLVSLTLHEPPAAEAWAHVVGTPLRRRVDAVLLDAREGTTWEALLDLSGAGTLEHCTPVDGVQPAITLEEFAQCEALVRSDPAWRAALEKRGVTAFDLVTVEAWGIGDFAAPDEAGRRLVWCPCWARHDPGDNPYAHPIEGVYPIVDLNRMEVLRVEDHGVIPVPEASGDFRAAAVGVFRDDLKPLDVVQPDGPSFRVDGWELRWQRWRMRLGFTQREGLVLHCVGYEDGGRVRPVLNRASIAELVIPYGDPTPGGYRRNAFDIGEYGAGPLTNSLELGRDCLGDVSYLDVDLCDGSGTPYAIRNAICIHEEDHGLLWKHLDAHTGHVELRRARRLVVSFVITADNYDYAFYWYFSQDGSIELEARLTGIVLTSAVAPGGKPRGGRLVAPQLAAPNHQHFFTVRLDMCVDGPRNSVCELHTESLPEGPENPHGNAFELVSTPLRREREARRRIDPAQARSWRIENRTSRNALGEPVAYRLVPGANVVPFALPGASIARRAAYLANHLWVTPFAERERYPAGDYPNQHAGGDGLAAWTEADRPIEDTHVVVWYTFGSHHVARLEDWPVMPCERIGFALRPDGFFDRNPSLDVPPPEQCRHDRADRPA